MGNGYDDAPAPKRKGEKRRRLAAYLSNGSGKGGDDGELFRCRRIPYRNLRKNFTMNQATNTLAPSYTNRLVQTEAASPFLLLAVTGTGRKAFLGDPEKFDSSVGPDITNAHLALRDGIDTIARLLKDETRNGVQRHEVAGVMTARTIEALQKAKTAIESRAELLYGGGVAQTEREFAPRASHASL
ncbi:hypothetical protein [Nitrosomonas sp. Nm58]|uniref:hypothetical protein n=1 Tax=Nitrosomonas sp. Nm58 TaxID=200126 RepID=UPI000B8957B8|nr:hypothetical protein [Nitrosomonas sp. Nm58]